MELGSDGFSVHQVSGTGHQVLWLKEIKFSQISYVSHLEDKHQVFPAHTFV